MVFLLPPTSNIVTVDKFCKKQRREQAGLSKSATESVSLEDRCELPVESFISSFMALQSNCEPVALFFRAKLSYSQFATLPAAEMLMVKISDVLSPTPLHSLCRIHIYIQTNGINTSLVPVIFYHLIKFKVLTTAPSRAGPLFIPSTSNFILPVPVLCHVQLFATSWTVDRQAPLSLGFPSKNNWSGLPFPSPGDLPSSGTEPTSPALAGEF